jgi:hypothetical protein
MTLLKELGYCAVQLPQFPNTTWEVEASQIGTVMWDYITCDNVPSGQSTVYNEELVCSMYTEQKYKRNM